MMLRVAHDLKCCSAAGLGERESSGGCSSWVHGLTGLGRAPRVAAWAVRGAVSCTTMRQCAVAGGGVPLPLLRAGRPHAGLKGRLCPPSHTSPRRLAFRGY